MAALSADGTAKKLKQRNQGEDVKTMEIRGVQYREAEVRHPIAAIEDGAICAQCVFANDREGCSEAIDLSEEVFGNDCMVRDVVYAKAE
jgi:hypothetical protein